MSNIELKDLIQIALGVWANIVATAALIHTVRKDKGKKETASHNRPRHMRKR